MILNFKHWLVLVLLGVCSCIAVHAADVGVPFWKGLTPQQQQVLAPLSAEWDGYTARGRKRLIALADRYPHLKPEEQARVTARLKAWAALSREDRDKARENFRKVRKLPPEKQAEVKQKLQAERDAQKKRETLRREAHEHAAKRLPVPAAAPLAPKPPAPKESAPATAPTDANATPAATQ